MNLNNELVFIRSIRYLPHLPAQDDSFEIKPQTWENCQFACGLALLLYFIDFSIPPYFLIELSNFLIGFLVCPYSHYIHRFSQSWKPEEFLMTADLHTTWQQLSHQLHALYTSQTTLLETCTGLKILVQA